VRNQKEGRSVLSARGHDPPETKSLEITNRWEEKWVVIQGLGGPTDSQQQKNKMGGGCGS